MPKANWLDRHVREQIQPLVDRGEMTRARGVLMAIDHAETVINRRRATRRRQPHDRLAKGGIRNAAATGGHPARVVEKRRQARVWKQPDATEKKVQEAERNMRRALKEGREDDGLLIGPLTVAADAIVGQLQEIHGLEGDEHRTAIRNYLIGAWGELALAFPEHVDIRGYHEWREQSRQRVLAAVAE